MLLHGVTVRTVAIDKNRIVTMPKVYSTKMLDFCGSFHQTYSCDDCVNLIEKQVHCEKINDAPTDT